jgi:hypothetical protein
MWKDAAVAYYHSVHLDRLREKRKTSIEIAEI